MLISPMVAIRSLDNYVGLPASTSCLLHVHHVALRWAGVLLGTSGHYLVVAESTITVSLDRAVQWLVLLFLPTSLGRGLHV